MSGDRMFRPREKGMRDPTSDERHNGRIVNPPRFAHLGGLKSAKKGSVKNDLVIKNIVVIPDVYRTLVSAVSNKLHAPVSGWDSSLWALHDWYRDA